MGLFEGMPTQCVQAIRHVSSLVAFKGGATIFREGEIAYKMYEVFSGEVEITRKAPDRGEIVLETLGKDGVFGEAGLLSGTHQRAGSARAKSDAVLYEISQDPVELLENARRPDCAILLVRNLMKVQRGRLQRLDDPMAARAKLQTAGGSVVTMDPDSALRTIEKFMPSGMLGKLFAKKSFKAGEDLMREGDSADSFYFMIDGAAAVVTKGGASTAAVIHAPAIVGEVGFLSAQPRSATIRATKPTVAMRFTGGDFTALLKADAEEALALAKAIMRWTIHTIEEREASQPLQA